MRDASSLIIHYLSYLPSGQTDESFRISQFLHDTLPQFIDMPTMSESVARLRQGVSIENMSIICLSSSSSSSSKLMVFFVIPPAPLKSVAGGILYLGLSICE